MSNAVEEKEYIERLETEIELFAYLLSHDLRHPVRHICDTCADLSAHNHLPQAITESLGHIRKEADHLHLLLTSLLEYMQIPMVKTPLKPIDCNALIQEILAAQSQLIEETGAIIEVASLPTIMGRTKQLSAAFTHLIENALKFRSLDRTCKIKLKAARQGAGWEFCLEDNGIGISEEYHQIIFIIFQRAPLEEARPGIGAGLALCQKIIEAHGGQLRVKSTPGEGSSFYFTLPALDSPQL